MFSLSAGQIKKFLELIVLIARLRLLDECIEIENCPNEVEIGEDFL